MVSTDHEGLQRGGTRHSRKPPRMERLRLKLSLPEGGPAGQGPTLNGNSTYRRVASESVICSAPYSMIAPATDNGLATRRADQIASLKPFATRNATFFDALLALIRISSPVAGLRPLRAGRAGRIRTCRTPRLGMRILLPFFSTRPMSATKPVNISIACFLATP